MKLLRFPDPDYAGSQRAQRSFVLAVKLAFGFIMVLWLVHAFQAISGLDLNQLGLRPREWTGLSGVLFTPLLHGSFEHLISNSMPLFIGGVALLFLYPNSALRVLPLLYLGTSLLAWVFARPSIHIGASGLVYGMLTYVFVAGVLRRDVRSVGVSLMVWFLYGSMVWGVFPIAPRMSWELHATGLVLGALLAWRYRRWDQPPVKVYEWENEDDGDSDSALRGTEHDEHAADWWKDQQQTRNEPGADDEPPPPPPRLH